MNDKPMYRIPEVAEHLNVSRSKVYELLKSGRLRSVHIDRTRLVRHADLEAYVASLTTAVGNARKWGRPVAMASFSSVADTPVVGTEFLSPTSGEQFTTGPSVDGSGDAFASDPLVESPSAAQFSDP